MVVCDGLKGVPDAVSTCWDKTRPDNGSAEIVSVGQGHCPSSECTIQAVTPGITPN